jgi:hypothetical protein
MNHLALKILATIVFTLGLLHGCDEKYSSRSKITQSESQSAGSSAKLLCPSDAEKCPDGTFVTRDPATCEMRKCGEKKSECEKTVTTCTFPILGTPDDFQPPPQECKVETLPCDEGAGDGSASPSCGPGEQLKTTKVCKRDPTTNQIECTLESECVPNGGSTPTTPGGGDCPEGEDGCYSGQ